MVPGSHGLALQDLLTKLKLIPAARGRTVSQNHIGTSLRKHITQSMSLCCAAGAFPRKRKSAGGGGVGEVEDCDGNDSKPQQHQQGHNIYYLTIQNVRMSVKNFRWGCLSFCASKDQSDQKRSGSIHCTKMAAHPYN